MKQYRIKFEFKDPVKYSHVSKKYEHLGEIRSQASILEWIEMNLYILYLFGFVAISAFR
jgi:hypothetical protein